jgi:hypothetical protein
MRKSWGRVDKKPPGSDLIGADGCLLFARVDQISSLQVWGADSTHPLAGQRIDMAPE